MLNPPPIKSTNSQKPKTRSRINKRQRNRRRNKQKSLNCNQNKTPSHFPSISRLTTQQSGTELWRNAYENAVRWHGEHQSNYWRHAAENLQIENEMLRQQLRLKGVANSKPDVYYETSDDEQEEDKKVISVKKETIDQEDDAVDVEYLEFLQITFKHREELRLKRQAEAQEVVDPPSPTTAETPLLG